MKKLNYNYVVFNVVESKLKLNPNGYYTICLRDLDNIIGIEPIYYPLQHKNIFLRVLYNLHHSEKINKYIRLPFKQIWFPYLFKGEFDTLKNLCFVFVGRLSLEYCKYLKSKYPNCKLVLLYRDLKFVTDRLYPELSNNPIFDLQMSIDAVESDRYGWVHFDEFESKIDVPISNNYPESDVFFAGKAKDRLSRLMRAYDIFTQAGLKCKYYLTGVPQAERKDLPGIEYADKFMSYTEMLYHTVNTRCVLEINQEKAVGYTSRFLEAVMFNKRLITDNKDVMKSKFYTPENILYINKIEDINPSFITNEDVVNYNYNNEFSPIHLIEKIDTELMKRYGEKS